MRSERGFTLIELLVATAIWVGLTGTLLYATQTLLGGARQIASARADYRAVQRLVEQWDSEASSALAIFVPPRDVLGNANADGHEFDFYTRDAAHYGHFWAYRFDAAAQTIQRYTYAVPGEAATAADPPVAGIVALRASRKAASGLNQPFLGGYTPKDVVVNFGYPGVDGGNALTDVVVTNRRGRFELELLPGTLVSGFSVVVGSFTPPPPAPGPAPSGGAPGPTLGPPTAAPPTPPPASTPVPQGSVPSTAAPGPAAPTASPSPPSAVTPPPAAPTVAVTTTPPTGGTGPGATMRIIQSDVCVPTQHQDGGGCVDSPEWLCQQWMSGSGAWATIETWLDSEHQWNDPPASWCS